MTLLRYRMWCVLCRILGVNEADERDDSGDRRGGVYRFKLCFELDEGWRQFARELGRQSRPADLRGEPG